jgi:hypothetical protein
LVVVIENDRVFETYLEEVPPHWLCCLAECYDRLLGRAPIGIPAPVTAAPVAIPIPPPASPNDKETEDHP